MKKRDITCIVCPIGCEITVKYDPEKEKIIDMEGATCKRGEKYAKKEVFHPERTLTSSIKVTGGELPLVSIRTDKAIPKEKIFPLMEVVRKEEVKAPVALGDIILSHPLDLDCNIIATKHVKKK